jgi:DNA-binding transcriptional ArsR family regulator
MTALCWDEATAYDFFISLHVLHRPEQFGLRASWAAGVRNRFAPAQREFLEDVQTFLPVPLRWLYLLPAGSHTAAGAITELAQLPITERLQSLSLTPQTSSQLTSTLRSIALRQKWDPADFEVLRKHFQRKGFPFKASDIQRMCETWAHAAEFGERFLQALESYYQSFFIEEEERIRPALRAGRERAEALAAECSRAELLEKLASGVHFGDLEALHRLALAPSFWASPLVFFQRIQPGLLLVLFNCRAAESSLVPGEAVPQHLVNSLKALGDPTRLRILRYLNDAPQTPSQLARLLRLRAPTVVHHLTALRLAGLVEITVQPEAERCYSIRADGLSGLLDGVQNYLQKPAEGAPG